MQLGIRQARYVVRKKTLFQLLMAATVANLTLLASKELERSLEGATFGLVLALLMLVMLTAVPSRRSTTSPNAIVTPTARDAPFEHRALLALRPTLQLRQMAGSQPDL